MELGLIDWIEQILTWLSFATNGVPQRALRIKTNNISTVFFFSYFYSIMRSKKNSLPDEWFHVKFRNSCDIGFSREI